MIVNGGNRQPFTQFPQMTPIEIRLRTNEANQDRSVVAFPICVRHLRHLREELFVQPAATASPPLPRTQPGPDSHPPSQLNFTTGSASIRAW